jgi:hypothetical protein
VLKTLDKLTYGIKEHGFGACALLRYRLSLAFLKIATHINHAKTPTTFSQRTT